MYGVVATYVCLSNFQLSYSPSTYLQTSVHVGVLENLLVGLGAKYMRLLHVVNPRRMRKGYGSRFVCVCVCVCVSVCLLPH